jgi:hypothetical protein
MAVSIIWLGLFPQPVIDTAKPALLKTIEAKEQAGSPASALRLPANTANRTPQTTYHFPTD